MTAVSEFQSTGRVKGSDNRVLMPMRVTDRFVTDPSCVRDGWVEGAGGGGSENRKRTERKTGRGKWCGGNFSSLRGARVMERDVSGTRQRAFFQSICPASRLRVNGTGPIKRAGYCGAEAGIDRVQEY